ncbi:MAG: MarR family transcriptional regulator [Rhodospirillales bacterium]|nr:MarR family transcriptional regulator [Rhodospirillales bacterium]
MSRYLWEAMRRQPDAIDAILDQWRRERPELDPSPMAPIGRLKRVSALVQRRLEANFARFDLTTAEFDVLATLRRSGPPYRLTPTELYSTMMVTSGTMTHRLQKLQARGLIARSAAEADGRSLLVELTEAGHALVDQVLEPHLQTERAILAHLRTDEVSVLNRLLSKLMLGLESERADG